MAALDFPDSPTVGQVFDKWTWNGTMWVLTPGGAAGYVFVQDTAPTPRKVGDTWFDTSTGATGGTSWVAIEEGAVGSEKVWVQTSPGAGANTQTYPNFFVQGGTAQSMASGAIVPATFTTESDPWNVLVNGVFTCPTTHPGYWHFDWSVNWPGPATGDRNVFLVTTPRARVGQVSVGNVTGTTSLTGAAMVNLLGTHQAYIVMFHNHPGGLLCNAAADNYFAGRFIGPAGAP